MSVIDRGRSNASSPTRRAHPPLSPSEIDVDQNSNPLSRDTIAIGHGYNPASAGGAAKPPIYMTSTFVSPTAAALKAQHALFFDGRAAEAGYIYARLGHPNLTVVEQRLAALDGAEDAACFASGMAAIATSFVSLLAPGQTILHSEPLYSGTDNLIYKELKRLKISGFGFTDGFDETAIDLAAERALAVGPIGMIWLESPANPIGTLVDIALVSTMSDRIALRQGSRPIIAVDNTFLGPILQNPLALGADLCMTSLTKYAAGHSDLLAGSLSGRAALLERLKSTRTLIGTTLDAHSAWLLTRSIETMALRTERAAENARKVAGFLATHDKVTWISHLDFLPAGSPQESLYRRQARGAGSTFSFKVKGGEREAFAMLDAMRLAKLAVSLGGTETLICHPATTTHFSVPAARRSAMGVDDSLIRVSVGIEAADDLLADFAQALGAF